MATLGTMGPFRFDDALAPGEARWVDFGESTGFADCALAATATAIEGRGGKSHVLKVDNVNITATDVGTGDIVMKVYNAGCNVTNNGTTTITQWAVLVGAIVP